MEKYYITDMPRIKIAHFLIVIISFGKKDTDHHSKQILEDNKLQRYSSAHTPIHNNVRI